MQSKLVLVHRILTGLISLAVLVQLLLAGLWHAGTLNDPESHVMLGFLMLLFSLIALVVAIAGRMDRRTIGTTALLFVLILLQPILIGQRHGGIAALSSLHTVNAAFIGMVGGMVAGTARANGREKAPQGSTVASVTGD
jgi:hypothetical protein